MNKVIRYIVPSLHGCAVPSRITHHVSPFAVLHLLSAILAFTFVSAASAQTNVIYGYVRDYTRDSQPRVTVTITCLYPDKRTDRLDDIRRDPLSAKTDAYGYYAFTNLLWG